MKEGMKIQWIYSLYADTLGELDWSDFIQRVLCHYSMFFISISKTGTQISVPNASMSIPILQPVGLVYQIPNQAQQTALGGGFHWTGYFFRNLFGDLKTVDSRTAELL